MAKANLVIDQGTDFSKELTVTDDAGAVVNLTGYTAAGQIRKHFSSNTRTRLLEGISTITPEVTRTSAFVRS